MSKYPFTLKTIGEWDKAVGVPLQAAMKVTMETLGKSGEQAINRCIIMMAQSAKAQTPTSKPRRPVLRDAGMGGAEYIETFTQSGQRSKLFKFRFGDKVAERDRLAGDWNTARKIANTGLAKRSWFWGLRGLSGAPQSGRMPIRNVARLITLRDRAARGYGLILENRLGYISKIMPANYEQEAVRSASNKILKQAAMKMEREYQRDLTRNVRAVAGGLLRAVA